MQLLTESIKRKLIANHEENLKHILKDGNTVDFKPVVKFFSPTGAATWLITELDPETNIMFGLCDLGFGSPEMGNVSFDELKSVRVQFGLEIERDKWFTADKTLTEYARDARNTGRIAA
jgi:hypothetical protein